MKRSSRIESQNKVTESARRLEQLLEQKLQSGMSEVDVSCRKSNLVSLVMDISRANSCGDSGACMTRLVQELPVALEQYLDSADSLARQKEANDSYKLNLVNAYQSLTKALKDTRRASVNSNGHLLITIRTLVCVTVLYVARRSVDAKHYLSQDYTIEEICQLLLKAKAKIEGEL